jgi:hypothetical protein
VTEVLLALPIPATMMESKTKEDLGPMSPNPFSKSEHKKYRLRQINFSHDTDIYKKYFQPSIAKRISGVQLLLGLAAMAVEVKLKQRNAPFIIQIDPY